MSAAPTVIGSPHDSTGVPTRTPDQRLWVFVWSTLGRAVTHDRSGKPERRTTAIENPM